MGYTRNIRISASIITPCRKYILYDCMLPLGRRRMLYENFCVADAIKSIVPSITCLSNHAIGRLTPRNIIFLVTKSHNSSM